MKVGNPIIVVVCSAIAIASIGYTGYTVWQGKLPNPGSPKVGANAQQGAEAAGSAKPQTGAPEGLLASLDRDPFGTWQPPTPAGNALAPMMPEGGMVAGNPGMGSGMSGGIQGPPAYVPPVRPAPPVAMTMSPSGAPMGGALPSVSPDGMTVQPATGQPTTAAKPAEPTKITLRALITAESTLAYIEIDGKPARAFKSGETVLKGLKVQYVSKRSIVVIRDGEPTTLRVGQEFQIL